MKRPKIEKIEDYNILRYTAAIEAYADWLETRLTIKQGHLVASMDLLEEKAKQIFSLNKELAELKAANKRLVRIIEDALDVEGTPSIHRILNKH